MDDCDYQKVSGRRTLRVNVCIEVFRFRIDSLRWERSSRLGFDGQRRKGPTLTYLVENGTLR